MRGVIRCSENAGMCSTGETKPAFLQLIRNRLLLAPSPTRSLRPHCTVSPFSVYSLTLNARNLCRSLHLHGRVWLRLPPSAQLHQAFSSSALDS